MTGGAGQGATLNRHTGTGVLTMTHLIATLRERARKRAEYNRTLAELRAMPLSTMIDFDIAPNELDRIARSAVYKA